MNRMDVLYLGILVLIAGLMIFWGLPLFLHHLSVVIDFWWR